MIPVLRACELVKRFGAVTALSDGRITVGPGEIHALLGANGCGKSTLCKIIAGSLGRDAGTMWLGEQAVDFARPLDAEAAGISLFYQELSLIPQLSVADNLFLGHEPRNKAGFVDRARLRRDVAGLMALFAPVAGSGFHPAARVGELPPDQRQIVELLKILGRRPRLMILDEATAALDHRQVATFFDILRARKAEGVSSIFISHRMDEVFAIADRVTVMRNGATVFESAIAETNRDQLIRHMVGDAVPPPALASTTRRVGVMPPLSLERGVGKQVAGISLTLAPGEIVGFGGLQGQGQSELLLGLFGARPLHAARLMLDGKPVSITNTAQAVRNGIAYVSGDRGRDAAFAGRSIFENLVAARLVRDRRWLALPSVLRGPARESAQSLKTKFTDLDAAIGTLSGGNQQKILIARWLSTAPRILLLDDPTKGIDLAAKADLFALMRRLADQGAAMLFYSSEDAELLGLCNRVLVFNSGRITAELEGASLDHYHLTRAAFEGAA
jgi:ribose transport system ATP-binding protein